MKQPPGFRRAEDEDTDWPEAIGTGHAGYLSDPDDGCDHEVGFGQHIYFRLKIGPFEIVIGRPE